MQTYKMLLITILAFGICVANCFVASHALGFVIFNAALTLLLVNELLLTETCHLALSVCIILPIIFGGIIGSTASANMANFEKILNTAQCLVL